MFNVWRKIPVVRVLLPLMVGILLRIHFPSITEYGMVAGILALLIFSVLIFWPILLHNSKYLFNICVLVLLVSLGIVLTDLKTGANDPLHYSHIENIELVDGVIDRAPEHGENAYKTIVKVRAVHADGSAVRTRGLILLYVSNKTELFWEKGDRILITRSPQAIEEPANPGEFDYRQYMFNRGITHRIFLGDPSQALLIQRGFESDWMSIFDKVRTRCLRLLENALDDPDAFGVSSALILGQKEFLTPQIRAAYAGTGAMHVLAVSGLHVGIIYLILMAGLKHLGNSKTVMWVRLFIILAALWSYAVVTGLSPSVVRASTMFSAVALAQNFGRRTNIYNTLAAAALVMLCSNPYLILDVGFQLSFTAVLAIVLLQPKIYGLLFFNGWLTDKIWQLTSVSVAAQLGTFPLGIYYFHQFPNYFLLTNLIVIPGAFLVLSLGIVLIILSWYSVFYELVGNLLNLIVVGMNGAVRWVESLPYALFSGLYLSNWELIVIYAFLGLAIACVYSPRPKLVIGTLLCCLFFLGTHTMRIHNSKKKRTVIVNDISNHFSLNLIDGDRNILVGDAALIADFETQTYHLANHWYRRGHAKATMIDVVADSVVSLPGFIKRGNFISFHGFRLHILRDEMDFSENADLLPELDLLVATGKAKVFNGVPNREIVVSSAYGYRHLCCDSTESPIHDVRKSRAAVIEIGEIDMDNRRHDAGF